MDFNIDEKDLAANQTTVKQMDVSKYHAVQKEISPKDNGLDAHNAMVSRGLENGSMAYHNGELVHVDPNGNIIG